MRRLESARDALDIVLLSASDPPEHQTIVLLGKPHEGGGVSVIIDGEVPLDELASTVSLLAGAAGPASPIVVATITPDIPALTEAELAAWHDLDDAVGSTTRCCASGSSSAGAPRSRSASGPTCCRGGRSAKVARADPAADGHRLELFGHDVDHALRLLDAAADQQRRRASRHAAVPRPTTLRADHVDEPGLVFEVDERRATGSRRAAGGGSPRRRPARGCRGRPPRASTRSRRPARRGDRARTGSGGLRAPHPSPTGRRSPPRAGLIPGNVGASAPSTTPARRSGRDCATAPADHNADRRVIGRPRCHVFEAAERTGGGERLEHGERRTVAPREVLHARVRATGGDGLGEVGSRHDAPTRCRDARPHRCATPRTVRAWPARRSR